MNQGTGYRVQGTGEKIQRPKNRQKNRGINDFLFLFSVLCFLFSATGCDAFVRKFTRPPKKKGVAQQDMVLMPQEYKNIDKEEVYRRYFTFWESWMDELINALELYPNYKKQVDSAERALKNMAYLKTLLNEDAQKKLDLYIGQLMDLKDALAADHYNNFKDDNRAMAERLQMSILRDFSYSAIKDSIIK